MTHCIRRYPFDNIPNFRDLGGYAAGSGGITRWGVFYRSGRLSSATPEEMDRIKAMGVRTVIDLRMDEEVHTQPDVCVHDPELAWQHISLMGSIPVDKEAMRLDPDTIPPMSTIYRLMIDHSKEQFRRLFEALAEGVQQGAVLFHCLAGKDRTGLTAMFLQSLCGVDRLDLIAHYEVSHTYNLDVWPDDTTGSSAQNMILLLDYLQEAYGGPAAYLRAAGVSEKALLTLYAHLYEPVG